MGKAFETNKQTSKQVKQTNNQTNKQTHKSSYNNKDIYVVNIVSNVSEKKDLLDFKFLVHKYTIVSSDYSVF